MSSSSTSDKQLSSRLPALALSRIVASGKFPLDDTASTWKDVQQALSHPKYVPLTVQRLLIKIRHIFLTNNPPSFQDAVIISECVRLIDDQVAKLDAANPAAITLVSIISTTSLSVSSTQSASSINQRKTPRSELLRVRKQLHSVDSAVRQLPQEIWQEIFSHLGMMAVFNLRDPLYIVGQVCQTWRNASRRCPRLWSRLYVSVSQASNLPHGVSRLRTVLERSCSVPLDFVFARSRVQQDDEREVSTQLLFLLMEHSARWRSVEFMGVTFAEALLLGNVRGRITKLRSVKLEVSFEPVEFERKDMVSAFQLAPELSHVNLRGILLDQLLDPCAKLRHLRVEYYRDAREEQSYRKYSLSDVLRAYPQLTNLTLQCSSSLDVVTWPVPPPHSTPRTVHTSLTSLSIADGDSIFTSSHTHINQPPLLHILPPLPVIKPRMRERSLTHAAQPHNL
ncbi:hypothetical protein BDZ89DRAFT_252798 [Hymenopellis radicata]|nr:hypothetical protein BDZ89DRAFT_252798 [Hymenopellis radicata]